MNEIGFTSKSWIRNAKSINSKKKNWAQKVISVTNVVGGLMCLAWGQGSIFYKLVPFAGMLQIQSILVAHIFLSTTVKLDYNDHGYNKFTLITNKIMSHFWSQMAGYKDIFHGYNESQL